MATISNPQMGGERSQGQMSSGASTNVGSPISNEAYDVIAALHAKLEGLEAYRKYMRDGGTIWQQLSDSDVQCVDTLLGELESLVRNGKLRMRTPGQAG